MTKHLAIKFAYDGTKFSGSQIQPNVRTVSGEIIECLIFHKVITEPQAARFQVACRTDAGVSALGNVFAIDTDSEKKDILNILNSKIDDCWFFGILQVEDEFNPRYAKLRWYRYHLFNGDFAARAGKLDLSLLNSITKSFLGTHNYKNFAKPNLDNTVRSIDSISILEAGDWLLIDIKAQSFLWNQVRRLVSSWIALAKGEISKDEIMAALNEPDLDYDFGLAVSKPLFLMDIEYNFEFEINKQTLKRIYLSLFNAWHEIKLKEKLFGYLLENV